MTADDLGARIRAARRRKRWSQQRLADEIGVALRTVGAWERGEVASLRYQEAMIDDLEHALGVDLTADPPAEDPDPDERQLWALNLPAATIRRLVAEYRAIGSRRSA